jgi:hypothetical protein
MIVQAEIKLMRKVGLYEGGKVKKGEEVGETRREDDACT